MKKIDFFYPVKDYYIPCNPHFLLTKIFTIMSKNNSDMGAEERAVQKAIEASRREAEERDKWAAMEAADLEHALRESDALSRKLKKKAPPPPFVETELALEVAGECRKKFNEILTELHSDPNITDSNQLLSVLTDFQQMLDNYNKSKR
jgi:hypothetical protein